MNFRALNDNILVKPQERPMSDVLVVIMDEAPNLGEVVVVGPGKFVKGKRKPMGVKVGDTIRFADHRNTFPEYFEDGVKYLVLQEGDVAGVVE